MDHSGCTQTYPVGKFIDPIIFDPASITKYVTNLPIPQKLAPDNSNDFVSTCTDCIQQTNHYTVQMVQTAVKLHPDIPPTLQWMYRGRIVPKDKFAPKSKPEFNTTTNPLIETKRLNPIKVKWQSHLPTTHLLSAYIDYTLHGVGFPAPEVRNVVHMHGGVQDPASDGFPTDWIQPGQYKNASYPADEPPSMLFWHDHAVGITRLNAYAGLSGGLYIVRDPKVELPLNLPRAKYEIPLVITDRIFDINGQLVFSTSNRSPCHPKWNPAFTGNTICVNNYVWPKLDVKATRYRFRIVNNSDTRTYDLRLADFNANTIVMYQIGTDSGFLPQPVTLRNLILAPAERADIIVDFNLYQQGTEILMLNTANAPYPNGGTPDPETVGQVMKFIVGKASKKRFCIRTPDSFTRLDPMNATVSRQLVLQVDHDRPAMPNALFLSNLAFSKPVSERPIVGATEIWQFVNISNGIHPIHIHLINFQIIERQKFDIPAYVAALMAANIHTTPGSGYPNPVDVNPYLIGSPIKIIYGDPCYKAGQCDQINTNDGSMISNEGGWKDTIQTFGGEVTRILIRFAPTISPEFSFDPTTGPYVWHCHILSHEDNDMMRPYKLYHQSSSLQT